MRTNFLYIFKYSKYILVSRKHTWPMGVCDVVLTREIWLNIILELRPHNEVYRMVLTIMAVYNSQASNDGRSIQSNLKCTAVVLLLNYYDYQLIL